MADIVLSISLLVSGRDKTTEKCLDSLKGILENVKSELILVDTGCDEKMRGMLRRYTDRIIPFVWCDDFAKARNAGLKEAKGEWFLFLDDDEWFEDVSPIVSFFTSGEYRKYDQAVYLARNYSDYEGAHYREEWVSRMIRLEPDTHFEGRVHEQLLPVKGKCKKIDAFVHHYGYVFASEEERIAHFKRNVDLLEMLIKEEPDNMRWYLQLIKEYSCLQDGARMRECGRQALAMIGESDSSFVNKCRGSFCTAVLMGDFLQGDYERLERDGNAFLKGQFVEDGKKAGASGQLLEIGGLCGIYFNLAQGAYAGKSYQNAAEYCGKYVAAYEDFWKAKRTEQEQIIDESIVLVNLCTTRESYWQICQDWGMALAALGIPEELPEDKRQELTDYYAACMRDNADFLSLPKETWELAAGGILPLEDLILGLSLSQWMAFVYVMESRNQLQSWEQVWQELSSIRTREDIRYDYFDRAKTCACIAAGVISEHYEDLRNLLKDFADSSIRFARKVYRGKAFEGEMELLAENDRAAVWIARALACEGGDWKEELEYLKRAALEWPKLGEIVKQFAKLLGEEQEMRQRAGNEANAELLQMASEIKKQIGMLMENGLRKEALQTVKQVRQMLPEDEELAKLEEELEDGKTAEAVRKNLSEKSPDTEDADCDDIVLSIALLVSNRKDTIQKCLDSLTPIREKIPSELIILDTGCDADLRQVLEEYADHISDFTWCQDFSKARNETLKFATGEWYMYLDDDEWFVDTEELVEFFLSGEYKKFGYASYIQRNFLDMEATQYTDSWVSRMTKREPDTHFESRIHEYMVPMDGDCKGLRSIVHHFGYVYETEEALRKHYDRNRVLLDEMIKEEPDNLRWRIQLAQEYRSVKEYEKLLALGEECLKLTKDRNEMYDNIALGGFYASKILSLKEMGRLEEALAVCRQGSADRRNTQLCQAFLSLRMAEICFLLGRYEETEKYANEYLRWKAFFDENEPLLFLQKPVPFVGECFDIVMVKEGYSLLICCGLKQKDTSNLKKYLPELKWEESHLYVFEHIVETMIEAMCTMPPEEIFEETLKLMHGNVPMWEYVSDQVIAWEESGHDASGIMALIRKAVPEALRQEGEGGEETAGAGESSEVGEVSEEMRTLACEIKEQLRTLIRGGYKQEAVKVLAQVRTMLPEDEELAELERQLK